MSVTTYTNCLRIERTDGYVLCITELDKDLVINDSQLGFTAKDQTYLSAAGYTPTNMQSTSDNAVNNADIEGVLSTVGVQREDIIGGRYDFAKLHIFIYDYVNGKVIKKLGSGHWGEATIKDGSYVAEFRSLSQQLQQTIGRTYNPECDEQLGGPRCGITLGVFPKQDGAVNTDTSYEYFTDTTSVKEDNYWVGGVLSWTSGLNSPVSQIIDHFIANKYTLASSMANIIAYGDQYSITKTFTGNATIDGTTTTFTDANRTETSFVGLTLTFTSGLNNTESRTITSFIANEFTLDPALPNSVLTGDSYEIDDSKIGSVNVYGGTKDKVIDSFGASNYAGMTLEFSSGLNDGEVRTIASNTSTELTLTAPFDEFIQGSDTYTIINMSGTTYMALGEIIAVTDSQNFTATLTGDTGSFINDYFNYGKLEFTNGLNDSIHMEVKSYTQAGGVFELFLPMPFQIEIGDNFQVFAGCDKRLETCKDKYTNHINFQGFPSSIVGALYSNI